MRLLHPSKPRHQARTAFATATHYIGAAGLIACSVSLPPSALALAQDGAPQPSTTAPASNARDYAIPAGTLSAVISRFAEQAGILLSVDATVTEGKTSPGVTGNYPTAEALARLLTGTGLEAVQLADGRYTLQVLPAPSEAAMLPAVQIQASAPSNVTERSGSLTTQAPVAAATGLGLTLRETPQSLTVITRERMEQQNLNSVGEVAAQVPGVFFNSSGTPIGGRSLLYSRGYPIDSYQVDGVNVPWEALAESEQYGHGGLDTAIYDSVTVVRGSTGLMTGAGEPSALMALTRKKPTGQRQTSLEATAGSWNRYRLMADVGAPLNASGSVRGRVVGAYDEGETWVDDYSSDRSILYGVLEMDMGPRTLLTLTLEHGTANSEQAPWGFDYGAYFYFADGETPIPPTTTTNIGAPWAYLNSDRTYASAAFAHEFNDDWSTTLSYGFGKFNTDMRRGMVRSIPADGSRTSARVLSLDYRYDTHIVDARIDGRYQLFGRQHELVAGINLYRNDQEAPLAYFNNALPDQAFWNGSDLIFDTPDWDALAGSEGDYPYDIETDQDGLYLATRLRPTDRLAVILGARLTNWSTFYAERETALNPFVVYDDRKYNNEFTPYAGVVFDVTRVFSAYASYTQIFQPQNNEDVNGRVLDPVEGSTYEIGFKGAWFEDRLNAGVAAFESKRDNLAVEDGDNLAPDGDLAYIGVDHTTGRGWELEVAGALTPRWQIQAGYTRFTNKDRSGTTLDTTQPEQQFKLYTSYEPALMQRLTIGASLRWQDDTTANPAFIVGNSDPNLYRIESHFVVGAHVAYALSQQLSLALALDNALDEEYRVSNYSHSYGAPRNATLTMRAEF